MQVAKRELALECNYTYCYIPCYIFSYTHYYVTLQSMQVAKRELALECNYTYEAAAQQQRLLM
jgi:hypothetical protein